MKTALNTNWDRVCNIKQKQHSAKETYDHLVKRMNKLEIYGGDLQRLPVKMQIYLYFKGLTKEIKGRICEVSPQPEKPDKRQNTECQKVTAIELLTDQHILNQSLSDPQITNVRDGNNRLMTS